MDSAIAIILSPVHSTSPVPRTHLPSTCYAPSHTQVAHVMAICIHSTFIFIYLLVFGYNLNEVWVPIR